MVSSRVLAVGAAVVGAALLLGRGGGSDGPTSAPGSGSGSSGSAMGLREIASNVVDTSPLSDVPTGADVPVAPGNTVTGGPVYQGPDPLDLAPGEEGRGDLIAPINPGNIVMGGPVWTGPDPLNLGGN